MKHATRWCAAAAAASCIAVMPALAEVDKPAAKPAKEAGAKPARGAQQNRMKTCNAEAAKKNLKGSERKAFMSTCLKG